MNKHIKLRKITKVILAYFCMMISACSCFGSSYIYKLNKETNTMKTAQSSISTISANVTPEFKFESEAQILIEPTTKTVLYENNADEHLLPASVTKVMTLLLTMEQIDSGALKYDDLITCSENASNMGGSQIWFKPGETLTVDEALKAICVVSANDVTMAMAEHIGGTEENFVKMMNEKAKSLGMNNTCFKNCHGIDEEGHYTCARDIATMSAELITKHPGIIKYTTIWMDTLRNGEFGLSNTNKLIKYYDGAIGVKTGYTSNALYNLSGAATRNGTTFLAVVLKAPSSEIRNKEVSELLNYGFSTYETTKIYEKGRVIDTLKINKTINQEALVQIDEDVLVLKNKGQKIETEQKITYNENLAAPITAGSIVGKIEIIDKDKNEVIQTKTLSLQNDIKKATYKDYFCEMFKIFLLNYSKT